MIEESMSNIQEKCQGCGGNLRFSPDHKALFCDFCKSIVDVNYDPNIAKHDYNNNAEDESGYSDFVNKTKVVKCSNCGASIVLDKLQVSKNCPYCDSPSVIETNEMAGLTPDAIIPFKYSEEKAAEKFKEGVKKKWFLPNKFKKSPPLDKIKGIYVPSFSFDANTQTRYSGVLAKTTTDSDGDTHTKVFNISGNYNRNFENFVVESSSNITQIDYNQIQPYKMNELVKFHTSFIMGYSVEHYNQNLNNCKNSADALMRAQIKKSILNQYDYTSVRSFNQQTQMSQEKYMYIVLPLYKVSYKYGKKEYTSLMNGQTGKVGGKLPKSKVKIGFMAFLGLLVGALILYLLICT